MAMQKITYDNKVAINVDSTIPDINKCNASDLNQIKSVVNNNADETPTKVSDLENDTGYITKDVDDLTNYTKTSDLSSVATSGSYNDLTDKPTIPSISDEYGTSTTDGYSQNYLNENTLNPTGDAQTTQSNVSSATITNTLEAPLLIDLKGNTSQTGTPTPSSPIPINNVSGDNEIVIDNNLLDTQYYENGTINANGVNVASDLDARGSNYIPVLPNTTYTFTSNTSVDILRLHEFKNDKTYITVQTNSNVSSLTITTSPDCYFVRWSLRYDGSTTVTKQIVNGLDLKLYKGTSYLSTTYNIDLPVENLFDKDNANVLNANVNNNDVSSSDNARTLYISCKSNTTYTISKIQSARFRVATTIVIPAIGVSTMQFDGTKDSATSITLTTNSNAKYLCVYYFLNGTDTLTEQQILDSIQIEEGSKANTYTPYGTTPIELNKIGTYQDYIYKENDKWYLHKEIGKVVLDGSENGWIKSGSATQTNFVGALNGTNMTNIFDIPNVDNSIIKSNRFTNTTSAGTTAGFIFYNVLDNKYTSFALSISTSLANDITTFKNWLDSNNTSIYYPLATPTNTEITYTPLINQLNTLEEAQSKEGTTNINQVNNDAPFILNITAFLDTYDGRYEGLKQGIENNKSDIEKNKNSIEDLQRANTYSTNEQVIGKWVDGKTLYRRTIIAQNLSTNTNNTINVENGSNLNVYNIYGIVIGGGTGYVCNINSLFGTDTTNNNVWCMFRTGEIRSYCGTYLTSNFKYDIYVTIEYTKTTD